MNIRETINNDYHVNATDVLSIHVLDGKVTLNGFLDSVYDGHVIGEDAQFVPTADADHEDVTNKERERETVYMYA